MRLIDDWRRVLARAWSIRVALLWGEVAGLYAAWPAFQEILPSWAYASLSVAMAASIAVARITDQPGADI